MSERELEAIMLFVGYFVGYLHSWLNERWAEQTNRTNPPEEKP